LQQGPTCLAGPQISVDEKGIAGSLGERELLPFADCLPQGDHGQLDE